MSTPEKSVQSIFSKDLVQTHPSARFDALEEGLPAEEVHQRALHARKALGKAQHALCFWLVDIEKRSLFKEFGCSSTFHYAETFLELAPVTISEFLRTGKELQKLPLLAEACAQGKIAPSKAREISRVARAETEQFWLKVGTTSSCRDVEKLVALTPKGGLPPSVEMHRNKDCHTAQDTSKPHSYKKEAPSINESDSPPPSEQDNSASNEAQDWPHEEGVGPSRYRFKLVVDLEGDQMDIVQKALDKARKMTGQRDRGMLLEFMARAFLQDDPPQNISSAPPCRVTLHSIPEAKLAWIESANGPQYVTEDKLLQALDDCEIIDLREKENPNQNHQEISTWKSDKKSKSKRKYGPHLRKSIPPTVRRKVLERDGNHCCLCHQRLFNQVHHIKPVCQGGNNSPQNLCTVCWVCHEALNKGRLYVEGTAPHGLIWRNAKGDILKSGIALTGSP